nr:cell cycle checkpoint protein RAD17-like isoform X1 [Parasteatoda tepidariorum]
MVVKGIPLCFCFMHWEKFFTPSSRDTMNDYMVSLASRGLMFNLSSVTNRRWRALHKPQFYENLSKQRRLQKSLKYAFSGSSLSMRQLQVDLVPYLSKLQIRDLNPAQVTLTKELGDMKIKKFFSQVGKTLDEKDHFCFGEKRSTQLMILTCQMKMSRYCLMKRLL